MKNHIFRPLCAVICAALLTGCSGAAGTGSGTAENAETEESEAQTLTVSDMDYYTRFKGQNLSINVYNWGEYISTGADAGTLNVNAEFTKLTGIKVNYTNYATNEELYAKLKGGGTYYDVIICSNSLYACDKDMWREAYECTTDGMRRDFTAENEYIDSFKGEVQTASTAVNDGFIKAQGVSDGTRSYGRVTDLILAHYYKALTEGT